jgi:L-threonylcarbamoyladenylate synthase
MVVVGVTYGASAMILGVDRAAPWGHRVDMSAIWKADARGIARAAGRLRAGGLIAVPTETVYGLAADAADGRAVASVFETKGRPSFNPLIAHVTGPSQASTLARMPDEAWRLADRFWPGPLTLVLERRPDAPLAEIACGGLPTVAMRAPAHEVAQALLEALGRPFVAPSANRSGRISPTLPEHVVEEFSGRVPVLDGGPCPGGIESTIVALRPEGPVLLRPGGLAKEAIEEALGRPLLKASGGIEAPGMMQSHYAPGSAVRLEAESAQDGEVLLGFGGTKGAALDLSPKGDLGEAAANLFAFLRRLDGKAPVIAVAPIPEEGLGLAINDRLRRAAAPRG